MTSPFAPVPPRDLAKMCIDVAVGYKVQHVAANAIDDHTSLEKDSAPVQIGAGVIGMYVATKLSPITDKAVDVAFEFVIAQREKRQAKKDKKNDSEEK
jgi:hypothetical protein